MPQPVGDLASDTRVEEGARAFYALPAYYDVEFASREQDVRFYRELAARTRVRRVLELGVGSGRIALPLARDGVGCVGVDASHAMLARLQSNAAVEAAEVAARVETHQLDMRTARLDERFDLVIAPFNTVLHLYTREDFERFCETVSAHLAPGGLFAFDFSAPRADDLALDPEQWLESGEAPHPITGQTVPYAERFSYAPNTQCLTMQLRFGEGPGACVVPLTHRQFFPAEMEALLHYNGFVQQRWLSDFNWGTPAAETDTWLVMCGRAGPLKSAQVFKRP